jgi:hypothetical protein
MSYYRELAGHRKFRCSQCGRIQHIKYVPARYEPTKYLCRRCAAKKGAEKRRRLNTLVTVPGKVKQSSVSGKVQRTSGAQRSLTVSPETDNYIITRQVEKRLRKQARDEAYEALPITPLEASWNAISRFCPLAFFIIFVIIAYTVDPEFVGYFWLVLFGGTIVCSWILIQISNSKISKPRNERNSKINSLFAELLKQREADLMEARRFYSSAEWLILRKEVIKEKGRICKNCGKTIDNDTDVTVDHIRPRSKYPDLALNVNNLQILCRVCNSRKGILIN